MLAMEYGLTKPNGIVSLIIANSPASMPLWVQEANRLREDLPPDVQATLLQHEAAGKTDSAEYQTAMMAFYVRHVCRIDPLPDYVARAFARMGAQIYTEIQRPQRIPRHRSSTIVGYSRSPRRDRDPEFANLGAIRRANPDARRNHPHEHSRQRVGDL